jgi:hypothetical protein
MKHLQIPLDSGNLSIKRSSLEFQRAPNRLARRPVAVPCNASAARVDPTGDCNVEGEVIVLCCVGHSSASLQWRNDFAEQVNRQVGPFSDSRRSTATFEG